MQSNHKYFIGGFLVRIFGIGPDGEWGDQKASNLRALLGRTNTILLYYLLLTVEFLAIPNFILGIVPV